MRVYADFPPVERIVSDIFAAFRPVRKLTHTEYQTINPLIDSALEGTFAFFALREQLAP